MVLLHFPSGVEYLFICILIFLFSVIAYFASFAHFFYWSSKIFKNIKIQDVEESRDFPIQNFMTDFFEALEILARVIHNSVKIKHMEQWIIILWWQLFQINLKNLIVQIHLCLSLYCGNWTLTRVFWCQKESNGNFLRESSQQRKIRTLRLM